MLRYLALAFLAVASADLYFDGPCPEVKSMESFDLASLQGLWYEIARFPDAESTNENGKCVTAEYFINGDKGKVKNTQLVDGVKKEIEAELSLAGPSQVMYTYMFDGVTKSPFLINVLDTDYKNYLITYNCKYFKDTNKHRVLSWIKAKSQSLEGSVKETVDNYLKNSKLINSSKYLFTDQSREGCVAL